MIINGVKYEGVCAHNGTKSGYLPDSYEDRFWLMKQVLNRTEKVEFQSKEWTPFKKVIEGQKFTVKNKIKKVSMDFDMKRKPDRNSMSETTVTIKCTEYKIVNFTTVPFKNVMEFKEYRQWKKNSKCLRTMDDWNNFWRKEKLKVQTVK